MSATAIRSMYSRVNKKTVITSIRNSILMADSERFGSVLIEKVIKETTIKNWTVKLNVFPWMVSVPSIISLILV